MRRKSTLANYDRRSDSFELKNTGLRPSWGAFWEVEAEADHSKEDISRTNTTSTTSTGKSDSGVKVVKFITGSEWIGEWDKLGMCGMGMYKMPHGVVYEGTMNSGVFEGIGVLRYPNGGVLEGFWHNGKLKYCQYDYADGLKRDTTVAWPYCKMPDRRFVTELVHGLRAADTELSTDEDPPREIPAGQYDAGDGFYNPRTKCVTDPHTGEILRIPTEIEESWTLKNCRMAEVQTIGFRPDLYENWYKKSVDNMWEENYTEEDKKMLSLLLQEGMELDHQMGSQRRSTSMQYKLDSLFNHTSASSIWSRSTGDFDGLLKKMIKDLDPLRDKSHSELTIDDEDSDEISVMKILHDIALSLSGKTDRQTAELKHTGSVVSKKEEAASKKEEAASKKEEAASTMKLESRMIAVPSSTSIATAPFYSNYSYDDYHTRSTGTRMFSKSNIGSDKDGTKNDPSEFLGSQVHYKVDYTDYEGSRESSKDTE